MVRSQILPKREIRIEVSVPANDSTSEKIRRFFVRPVQIPSPIVAPTIESSAEGRQPIVIRLPPREKWPLRLLWVVVGLQTAIFVTEIARVLLTAH